MSDLSYSLFSLKHAIDFVRKEGVDSFVAVGGGSVIDTAKAANLYLAHPEADFLDFVNAPIGKGIPPPNAVFPLIAGIFVLYLALLLYTNSTYDCWNWK